VRAGRAPDGVKAVLDDLRNDRRQLPGLRSLSVRILNLRQCAPTVLAVAGEVVDNVVDLLGWHERALRAFVPWLRTALLLLDAGIAALLRACLFSLAFLQAFGRRPRRRWLARV